MLLKEKGVTVDAYCAEKWLPGALGKLQAARLSLINRSSIFLVVSLEGARQKRRCLFTGDADGRDVIATLRKHNELDAEFDYVDIPHHGSYDNHIPEFLEAIRTKKLVVSTKRHKKRPASLVLKALDQYLIQHGKCLLYFNYTDSDRNFKWSEPVRDRIRRPGGNTHTVLNVFDHEL